MPPQVPQVPLRGSVNTLFQFVSERNSSISEGETTNNDSAAKDSSRIDLLRSLKVTTGGISDQNVKTSSENWGYPGFLSAQQLVALEGLQSYVNQRDESVWSTVFTFSDSNENELYALCRWLRPCKFNVSKTIKKIEEATKYSTEAREKNYYHHPENPCYALAVEPSIYLQQFPQFYHGVSKEGLPIFYAKAGVINTKAIGCLTTSNCALQFHWHDMFHQRNNVFKRLNESNGGCMSTKRYEILYILDVKHLSAVQMNKELLSLTKIQCKMDELCFPEAMKKMVILNAPSSFAMLWRIVKSWIDPRNATKVEIFGSNKAQWEKRLCELVDRDQLPCDYGGWDHNDTSHDIMQNQMIEQYKSMNLDLERDIIKEETHFMNFRQNESSQEISVKPGQKTSLSVFTNSSSGGILKITNSNGELIRGMPPQGLDIRHVSEEDQCETNVSTSINPTRYNLDEYGICLSIPGSYKVYISLGQKLCGNFLLVSKSYNDNSPRCDEVQKRENYAVSVFKDKTLNMSGISLGVGMFGDEEDLDDEYVDFQQYEYMFEC